MKEHLERVKAAMQAAAVEQGLPTHFRDDLGIDYNDLERFDGLDLVWLLRSCGTVFHPIGVGSDPIFATHWLTSAHGQQIRAFWVSTKPGADPVTPISFNEAYRLAKLPPSAPIEDVLKRGIVLGLWGETPQKIDNWRGWFDFFESSGNHLMSTLIRRRMRVRRAMA